MADNRSFQSAFVLKNYTTTTKKKKDGVCMIVFESNGQMKCEIHHKVPWWTLTQTSRPVRHLLGWRHKFILWAFFLFLPFFSLFPSPSLALPPPAPFLSLSLTLGLFDCKGLEQIRSRTAASRGLAPTQVRLDVQLRTVLPVLGLTRGGKGGETERENGQTSVLC